MSDRLSSEGSWRWGSEQRVLQAILSPDVNAVVQKRTLPTDLASELTTIAQAMVIPRQQSIVPTSGQQLSDIIQGIVSYCPRSVRTALFDEILLHVATVQALTGASLLTVSFGSVLGDECAKYHCDDVWLRLLVTYAGLGTVIVNETALHSHDKPLTTTRSLEPGGFSVADPQGIRAAAPGDIVLLKGRSWEGNRCPVVHRSPSHSDGRWSPRIVLSVTKFGNEDLPSAPKVYTSQLSGHNVVVYRDAETLNGVLPSAHQCTGHDCGFHTLLRQNQG